MKAEITDCNLQCDVAPCDWSHPCDFADIPQWHRKPCPKCGQGVIVNDDDLVACHVASLLVSMTNTLDPDGALPRQSILVDTSVLRHKEATP